MSYCNNETVSWRDPTTWTFVLHGGNVWTASDRRPFHPDCVIVYAQPSATAVDFLLLLQVYEERKKRDSNNINDNNGSVTCFTTQEVANVCVRVLYFYFFCPSPAVF